MELDAILDNLDAVEEPYKKLYTERNGKFELTAVKGFKTQADVDRLSAAAAKERDEHKKTKDRYSVLGDIDPAEARKQLDRITELEAAAAGKLDEAGIQKLVEGRLTTVTAPLKRELDTFRNQLAERDEIINTYKSKELQRTLADSIRAACIEAKLQDSAIEDAILLGERMFELDEQGNVITKDGVGVTPGVSPKVWLQDMQPKRPHWWGPSVGGGAQGGRTGTGGTNPWSAEGWNMTEQGKILTANRSQAEQMAKQAGTSIGGPRPAVKK